MNITFNNTQAAIDTFLNIPNQTYSNDEYYTICHYLDKISYNVENSDFKNKVLDKITELSSKNTSNIAMCDIDISQFIVPQKYDYNDFNMIISILLELVTQYKPTIRVNLVIKLFDIMYLHNDMLRNDDNIFIKKAKERLLENLQNKLFQFLHEPYQHLQDVCKKYLFLIFDINVNVHDNYDILMDLRIPPVTTT